MQAGGDKLARDLKVVVQDAEDLIKATAGDIEERTREARAKLAGALVVAKDSLIKAEEAATDSARVTDALIRQYPYQSLGVAFAFGLLLGVIATRR